MSDSDSSATRAKRAECNEGSSAHPISWTESIVDRDLNVKSSVPVLVTLALAVVPGLIAAIKIMVFSKADPAITAAVVSSVSLPAVYVGTLVSILPILLLSGGAAICIRLPRIVGTGSGSETAYYVVGIAGLTLALLGLVNTPWLYLVGLLAVGLVASIPHVVSHRSFSVVAASLGRYFTGGPVVVQLCILIFVTFLSGGAWLPQENLTIVGSERVSGYVLTASVAGVTIYTLQPLSIRTVKAADLTREACSRSRSVTDESILGLFRETVLPRCV